MNPRCFLNVIISTACVLMFSAPVSASDMCTLTIGGETFTANPAKGKRVYLKCRACHTLAPGGRNMVGPNLGYLFSRGPLGAKGFAYSQAFQDKSPVWDHESLSAFIANPRASVPGSKMLFVGIRSDQERADLIAYLKQETDPDTSCGS